MVQEKTVDRRTRRTVAAIKKAFREVADEKGFDNVTVSEIAERADINRKTFYHHYDSIEALQEQILKERVEAVSGVLRDGLVVKDGKLDVESLFQTVSAIIAGEANVDGAAVMNIDVERHARHLEPILIRAMMKDVPELFGEVPEQYLHYVATFFCAGLLAAYRRWAKDESEVDMGELANMLGACIAGGVTYLGEYSESCTAQ